MFLADEAFDQLKYWNCKLLMFMRMNVNYIQFF